MKKPTSKQSQYARRQLVKDKPNPQKLTRKKYDYSGKALKVDKS